MKKSAKLRWMLVVHKGATADMMLHRLGFRPSTSKATDYINFYAIKAKPKMLRDIDRLNAVGLHSYAKKIVVNRKPVITSRKRAAKPAAATKPNAEILTITARRDARLKHDAEKRKANAAALNQSAAARQRRTVAAEVDARARDALLRAKGEL